jgi:hypothetical protein
MTLLTVAFLQSDTSSDAGSALGAGLGMGVLLLWCAVVVLLVAALWKVFVKAGEPGWAAIVPIYNLIVLLKIAGKPVWWILLFLIPFVNFIIAIIVDIAVAERFGKGAGFGLGLALLPFVFFPILAWGDARYQGGVSPAIA